jgi:hypothetical protein
MTLATITLFATAQFGDYMIIDGKKEEIFSNPLEAYLRENRVTFFKNAGICSACWRGYQATWDIFDEYLYIVGLHECSCSPKDQPIALQKIFKDLKEDKVKAVWFSGEIRIPLGKRLKYVHLGYMSLYEQDLFLKFEKGRLIGRRLVDNRKKSNPLDQLH